MSASSIPQERREPAPQHGLRLQARHLTRFEYEGPATDSFNDARLCPITDPMQRVEFFGMRITPETPVSTYHDFFLNRVDHFELPDPHDSLEVESLTVVETKPDPRDAEPGPVRPESLNDPAIPENYFDFLTDTHYVSLEPEVWRESIDVVPDGVKDLWMDSARIGQHIHSTFEYVPKATTAATRMIDVFKARRGVCQDFAHVMLAMCRTQGIPARYVSGYFFNEKRAADEAQASHAWVEIFLPGYGWKGFDPTHNRTVDTRYLKLAVGRDYADIRPLSGTFRGKGTRKMTVEVQVTLAT